MNVLYLTQVFEVGADPGSERHFYFCRYLARRGHQATAITSNVDYKKACVRISGSNGTVTRKIDGVEIHYVYSYPNFRGSFFRRFIYFITYFFSTLIESFKIEKPDVIYAVSTPLTVGLLGFILSRLRRVPFVFEVTDVWPDAAIACGVIRNHALIRVAKWLELLCYRKSSHIVALTQGIRNNIVDKGISADKVTVITNGVDFSLFCEGAALNTGSESYQEYESKPFIAMYMGAHGTYNSLDTIIDAAIFLKDDARFLFILVGDGDAKASLQERVNLLGLKNVQFMDSVPRIDSPAVLATADVFLLPNRKGEFFTGNLPNKLFDFLASARPIIVAGRGETGAVVVSAGCGLVVDAEDGRAMAQAIRQLAEQPIEARCSMGEAGKNFVKEHYDRERLSLIFLSILNQVTGHEASTGPGE